jgi:hypothetical protein
MSRADCHALAGQDEYRADVAAGRTIRVVRAGRLSEISEFRGADHGFVAL